jgi:hypothetical protein
MYILASASKLAELVLDHLFALLLLGSFLFLFWGLLWDRILIKAGFFGKTYWRIYGLLMTPCLGFVIGSVFLYDPNTDEVLWVGELLFGITVFVGYIGMAAIAYMPWPVVKQLKQIRQAKQVPEPVTTPTGILGLPANWYNAMSRKIKGKK